MGVKRKRVERGKEEEEEDDLLKLKLWSDTWDVMKKLNKSDLDHHLRRVILPSDQVRKHVLPFLSKSERQEVEGKNEGLNVHVDDLNTGSYYFLSFKKWKSNGSYKLGRDWIQEFVVKRQLRKDDMIGMCWNQSTRGFCFSVIKRSPAYPPPDPSLCEFARKNLRLSPPTPDLFIDALES
ncbi:B3 domain-containing protein At2g33720-like [Macadamia integrifolia]|uniref:B3 domain-containing protein At2g33720-like n=1 Tax=Macadamia integrifolia TaxID=60698 RepID=UPI001C4E5373|nr:B3 domain-containing protein At2g33720-like [Macadamia integrifolia]